MQLSLNEENKGKINGDEILQHYPLLTLVELQHKQRNKLLVLM